MENLQENFVYLSIHTQIEAGGYGSRGNRSLAELKAREDLQAKYICLRNMELRCSNDDAILFKLAWMNRS